MKASIIAKCLGLIALPLAIALAAEEPCHLPWTAQGAAQRQAGRVCPDDAGPASGAEASQRISDAEIQAAIDHGRSSTSKKVWKNITKEQQFRINRAGLTDPIEKKVTFLFPADRIALEAAEATRQLRDVSFAQVKESLGSPVVEVLLEANCYNRNYAGSLSKWSSVGGVHVVLEVGGQIIQPLNTKAGSSDAVSVLPQEHGLLTRQGNQVTYTPLYYSALYERASQRSWFLFPELPKGTRATVVVISGDGKRKEKELDPWGR